MNRVTLATALSILLPLASLGCVGEPRVPDGISCESADDCRVGHTCVASRCLERVDSPDVGEIEADGSPASSTVDQGPEAQCGGSCGAAQVCDPTSGRCEACIVDEHCEGQVCHEGECVDCRADADCAAPFVCDVGGSHACVRCVDDGDCTDPDAPVCDAENRCAPCAVHADCEHLTDTPICGPRGTCVQCLDDDETTRAACGGRSCDPSTRACTNVPTQSVDVCEPCSADSECAEGHACVQMTFDTQPVQSGAASGFCLLVTEDGRCPRPYRHVLELRSSLSSNDLRTFCAVNEQLTTCVALLHYVNDRECQVADECGVSGFPDGRCNEQMRCTIPCSLPAHCPEGVECEDGICGY